MSILVIGSFMMDLVVRTPRAPQDGETVIGTNFSRFPGGKGANQAVAIARMGGDVMMAGKLGRDPFGDEAIQTLNGEQVDTTHLLRDEHYPTGVGSVTLDEGGNNRIVVVPGANLAYRVEELTNIRSLIQKANLLIMQLEMDMGMTERAVSMAYDYGVPTILNPAPAQELSDELLGKVTYLTPNESEVEILTGIKVTTKETARQAGCVLLNRGVQYVILTLGSYGSFVVTREDAYHVPGIPVKPHDTVAAGDAFNGALAVGIVQKYTLYSAIRRANAVGALAVTRPGAIPSLPTTREVEEFMKKADNGQ